ncbi:MAG TPA: ABC transporter ATP-binding protein, partial [Planctomycetota bacterium]|nr:ABC transporter ATP-binding protein [Planctomycetota bacterium]
MSSFDSELAETASLRNIGIVRRLWPMLRPHRAALGLAVVGLLFIIAGDVARPWFVKHIVDGGLLTGEQKSLWFWIALYVGTAFGGALVSAFSNYLTLGTGQKLMATLRAALYRRFQAFPLGYFDRVPAGKTLARMINDANHIGEPLANGLVYLVGNSLRVVGYLAFMFFVDWRLTLVGLAFMPVTVVLGILFRPHFLRAYRWCREMVSQLNVRMEEQISGHNTLVLLGQEKRSSAELDGANEAHRAAWVKALNLHVYFSPLLQLTFGLAVALILWYGGIRYFDHELQIGTLLAFVIFFQDMGWPFMEMVEQVQSLQSAVAALERVFKFLDLPDSDDPNVGARSVPTWGAGGRARGEIEFRDVWFAYKEEQWILKGLSFKVRPGERVAVAGPTGAGKTTILSLASALYRPQKGQILIDGSDISALDPREVRRQVAVVIQDVFLFAGTVEENIRLWEPGFGRERVEEAARRACAHEFIAGLPDGYAHKLGERAQTLSAGQRQLVSFARALCFDPPVLLLDEATSSVDAYTEDLIRRGLKNITAGRASIIVAHRFSTLADADRLLVIRDGVLAEETIDA